MSEAREYRPGQTWGFWAFDDSLYVKFTIDRIEGSTAFGHDEDNSVSLVGLRRLERATLISEARYPPPMQITTEQEAFEALHAVLAWASAEPDSQHGGRATGTTYQRGRIIATDVHPERTIGVSTYLTIEDANKKAADMEQGFRNWRAMSDIEPTVIIGRTRKRD